MYFGCLGRPWPEVGVSFEEDDVHGVEVFGSVVADIRGVGFEEDVVEGVRVSDQEFDFGIDHFLHVFEALGLYGGDGTSRMSDSYSTKHFAHS